MIFKSITVIKHDNLIIGNAIFINKPDLAIFRYQTKDMILHQNIKIEVLGVYSFLSYKYLFHNIYLFIL